MHSKEPEFSENDIPDLSGYVAIVTGGKLYRYAAVIEAFRLHSLLIVYAGRQLRYWI